MEADLKGDNPPNQMLKDKSKSLWQVAKANEDDNDWSRRKETQSTPQVDDKSLIPHYKNNHHKTGFFNPRQTTTSREWVRLGIDSLFYVFMYLKPDDNDFLTSFLNMLKQNQIRCRKKELIWKCKAKNNQDQSRMYISTENSSTANWRNTSSKLSRNTFASLHWQFHAADEVIDKNVSKATSWSSGNRW